MEEKLYKFHEEIKLECPSMIIGWNEDAGGIGTGVVSYLVKKLKGRLLAEIEPTGFFPLNGVTIRDDVARFPESKLYYCPENELLLFESDSPHADWYRFLNTVIDMAQFHCRLNEIYTIGGMIALNAHTAPRRVTAVASLPEEKAEIRGFEIDSAMNYETPEGQRPTLSSYLIWVAGQRKIKGASIWAPIPFYLTSVDDPQSWRMLLIFFDKKFGLNLNFADLDRSIAAQNEKLSQARLNTPELDEYIKRLETNQPLSQEENDKLVMEIEEILKK